jgi:hypothetical protein
LRDLLKRAGLFCNGALNREPLDARSAEKPVYAAGVFENEASVIGFGDRAAVADHQHVRIDGSARVANRLYALGGYLQRESSSSANGAFGRQAHMGDEYIGAGLGHQVRLILVEDIRAGKQIQPARQSNHLDLETIAHARFFQILPEYAIE